ncbi:MAG: hypothetical protein AB7S71_15390 [Dongiaceae bacterium]
MVETILTRSDIEAAFDDIGRAAFTAGKIIELAVVGGAAIVLLFVARPATRDVDAVVNGDTAFVREQTQRVAHERGWRQDWLNDSVKGFLSARHNDPDVMRLFRTYPSEREAGLRVFVARPEYLLAMKCLAMRVGSPTSRDTDDIKTLIRHLGLSNADQVLDIVASYYPNRLIQPRTQFGVQEIVQSLANEATDE